MKQFRLILFFILAISISSFSQDRKSKDSIIMTGHAMEGIRFYQHGQKINMRRLTEIVKENPDAYTYLKKSKGNNLPGIVLGIAGGFLLGYELGSLAGGKSIDWAVMASGIGCIGLSIPFTLVAKRNAKKAVDLYNSSLR
jgi:hypothetical protein